MKQENFDMLENLPETTRLIIKACVMDDGKEREKIVREWEGLTVMDEMVYAEMRLVPLFYWKNQKSGIITKYDSRLKVIYKYWWLRSNHILDQLKKVHALFVEHGIDTVLIKGSSLVSYYERPELRAMADFDILIHPGDIDKAAELLRLAGYVPEEPRSTVYHKKPVLLTTFRHALQFRQKVTKTETDLHWRIGSLCSLQFTNSLWQHTTENVSVPGSKKPQLAYEVFIIIIHAVMSAGMDNLSWMIDIATLKLTPEVWQQARGIAISENKAGQFDYGCSVLLKNGIDAPVKPGMVKPKLRPYAAYPNRDDWSTARRVVLWFDEYFYYLKYFLPNTSIANKIYQGTIYFARFLQFKVINWRAEKALAVHHKR